LWRERDKIIIIREAIKNRLNSGTASWLSVHSLLTASLLSTIMKTEK
jgi:hypothetical protein